MSLPDDVRRGIHRAERDNAVATIVGGGMMLGTIVVAIVVLAKTGSLVAAGICFLGGVGGILGFGTVFWRDKL